MNTLPARAKEGTPDAALRHRMFKVCLAAGMTAATFALAGQVAAQGARYPQRPVRIIVNVSAGGGVDIALMCDMRFAARSAKFAETYVKMGLIPGAGGAYYLPRIVGVAKALELFWSGEAVDAEEALRIGLVNRVFDDERLAEETQAFASKLARGAPLAVKLVKRILYRGLETDLRGALDLVASNMPVVRMSEDHQEAIAAFREKREPKFSGK